MRVIRGIQPDLYAATAVTLGMFDGVHLGHQVLLHACGHQADRLGIPAVALTYDPHPSHVLHPERPVHLLTPLPEKLARLALHGVDATVVADFTREFSRLTPEQFLRDVLVPSLHPQVIVTGYRSTFGHGRAGSADVLRDLSAHLGFHLEIVEPLDVAGAPVSSSRIRADLHHGRVAAAAELLGYRYRLIGTIVHGDARGRELGIPTANLDVPETKLIPADGVYVVDVEMDERSYRGVMAIGNRPTFGRPYSLEIHLLDFDGDLYGRQLTAIFHSYLREVRAFATPEALLAQIREDIARARNA